MRFTQAKSKIKKIEDNVANFILSLNWILLALRKRNKFCLINEKNAKDQKNISLPECMEFSHITIFQSLKHVVYFSLFWSHEELVV